MGTLQFNLHQYLCHIGNVLPDSMSSGGGNVESGGEIAGDGNCASGAGATLGPAHTTTSFPK